MVILAVQGEAGCQEKRPQMVMNGANHLILTVRLRGLLLGSP
jgi:hypothetical protein